MDVGQLLARMNPKTVNYMGVCGGEPELTTADIAGALAFVPKGLGRSVLEAVYWPDGACRTNDLRNAVMGLVMPELSRQLYCLQEAELDLQLTQAAVQWSNRGITHEQQKAIERARCNLESVRAKTWPRKTVEHIPIITRAIVREMSGAVKCPSCSGYGEIERNGIQGQCDNCKASGQVFYSDRGRASLINCDHALYLRCWKRVYVWTFDKLLDAKYKAYRHFEAALYRKVSA